jgi:protein O-GlcNAc transferase
VTLETALAAHRTGQLEVAAPLYRSLLDKDPHNPDLHHLLALAIHARDPRGAWMELRRAMALAPNASLYLHNAARLAPTEEPELIARLLSHALALDPSAVEAQHRLGAIAAVFGKPRLARIRFRRARALDPAFPPALYDQANLVRDAGDMAQAICLYRRLSAGGTHLEGLGTLAAVLSRCGRSAEAVLILDRLARVAPARDDIHGARGAALADIGNHKAAISAFRQALTLAPGSPEAWHALAGALTTLPEESETAIGACHRVSAIQPTAFEPQVIRSVALFHQGRVREAIAARRASIALIPADAQTHYEFLSFLHLDPDLEPAEQLAYRRRVHRRFSDPLTRQAAPHRNDRDPERRLRIGYVDNRMLYRSTHSTNLLPMVEAHDREQVAVHFYTNLPTALADDMTARYRAVATGFHHVGDHTDAEVAGMVREDDIDILIDVSGHLTGVRTGVFARKPAPIQVTMMQVGSSGLAAMDYAVADPVLLPGDQPSFFTEAVIRLPMGFLFEPVADLTPPIAATPPSRPPTFGSLNLLAKINDRVLDLWARVLVQVPQSRLLLKAAGLASPATRRRLITFFAERGIAPERLVLRSWTNGYADHLATFNEIDVVLDCFPYPGMTTSLEALLMGVPVVSLAGDRFVSRIGEAILVAIGHPEWIARDEEAYVAIAAGLAADPEGRSALRQRLRGELLASPLGDARGLTGALEAAFRQAWRRWCGGLGP